MAVDVIPYDLPSHDSAWQRQRGLALLDEMGGRRSCRYFSNAPIDPDVLRLALEIAHSAPSGANRKPWRFVIVDNPALKKEIRIAAETEERESYNHRMPKQWLEALEPLGTNWEKPYLEIAPALVVVFRINWEMDGDKRVKNYYPAESAGLACGFFLMACHMLGLATLTHTPSPMRFLNKILCRPAGEKPYLLIPVGYPSADCTVPNLKMKPLSEALQWNRSTREEASG